MHNVFISLGSNLGDREKYLQQAVDFLSELGEIKKASRVIETKPWGKENQPDFLNQMILIETKLSPQELLKECQKIEKKLGRKRTEKWGERTIDLDILFYDDLILKTENLNIPHPYLAEREFVLKPLSEIAPHFLHPVLGESVSALLKHLKNEK